MSILNYILYNEQEHEMMGGKQYQVIQHELSY